MKNRRIKLIMDSNGYYILNYDHLTMKLHRLIMEHHLGRCLKEEEIIHHKNGDIRDNRVCNLELSTNSRHMTYHRRKANPKLYHDINWLRAKIDDGYTQKEIANECEVSIAAVNSFVRRFIDNDDCESWKEFYNKRRCHQ